MRMGMRLSVSMLAVARSCASGKGSPEEYYFNPLKCPLPKAPSMGLYCLYGVGIPTERSYYYLNLESDKVRQGTSLLGSPNWEDSMPRACAGHASRT